MTLQEMIVGVVVALLVVALLLLGVVMIIRGLSSARNAYLALLGEETDPTDLDAGGDTATVKLSGTVRDVPEPVETADGREAAVYHLKSVAKNWRNLPRKGKKVRYLLAEGARLRRAVVVGAASDASLDRSSDGGDGGTWEVTADPIDENRRWGGVQEGDGRGWGTALKRPDVATGEWTEKEKYTNEADVPDRVVDYLESEYDADVDVDVSASLVSLTVAEDAIGVGDDIRLVGKVQPEQSAEATAEQVTAADGGDPTVSLNLTPGATVTGGSWRTLAWTEAKSAVKAPVGLVLVAMGVAAPLLVLAQIGFLSLGLGL